MQHRLQLLSNDPHRSTSWLHPKPGRSASSSMLLVQLEVAGGYLKQKPSKAASCSRKLLRSSRFTEVLTQKGIDHQRGERRVQAYPNGQPGQECEGQALRYEHETHCETLVRMSRSCGALTNLNLNRWLIYINFCHSPACNKVALDRVWQFPHLLGVFWSRSTSEKAWRCKSLLWKKKLMAWTKVVTQASHESNIRR